MRDPSNVAVSSFPDSFNLFVTTIDDFSPDIDITDVKKKHTNYSSILLEYNNLGL